MHVKAYGKPELGDEINKKLESYYADYVSFMHWHSR